MDGRAELVRRVLEGSRSAGWCWRWSGGARPGGRPAAGPGDRDPYLQMVLTRLWAREAEEGSRRLRLRTLEALGGPQRSSGPTWTRRWTGSGPSSRRRPRPSSTTWSPRPAARSATARPTWPTTPGCPPSGCGRCWRHWRRRRPASSGRCRPCPGWTRSLATRSSTTCSPRRSWAGGPSGRPGGRPRRPPAASSSSGPGAGGAARRWPRCSPSCSGGGGRAGRAGRCWTPGPSRRPRRRRRWTCARTRARPARRRPGRPRTPTWPRRTPSAPGAGPTAR